MCVSASRKKNKLKISWRGETNARLRLVIHFFHTRRQKGRVEGAVWGLAFNLMPITCMSRINTHTHTETHTAAAHSHRYFRRGELAENKKINQKIRRQLKSMQRKIRKEK